MSEMLFECYGAPSVAYGVDALFGWVRDTPGATRGDSLVLRLGHHCSHVLPVLDGAVRAEHARRINLGGIHLTGFFHRLMQLKNPLLAPAISLSRTEVRPSTGAIFFFKMRQFWGTFVTVFGPLVRNFRPEFPKLHHPWF
jgi:actin-related protein